MPARWFEPVGRREKTSVTLAPIALEPALPTARGPLSFAVTKLLTERAPRTLLHPVEASIRDSDPYGIDVQLSLYICYELHYRGFTGVDPGWEWNPGLLHLRAQLESAFLTAVRRDVGDLTEADSEAEMDRISREPAKGRGPSHHLRDDGTWEQMREYFVHRSLYHLKEGDPHAWAIPRLTGRAKAAFVAVEFDEFGAGRAEQVHQQLFADVLAAADLNPAYLAYIGSVPAEALAVVNLMSLFGLHRVHRGAAVGHFAATEITSSPGSRRLLDALTRMNAPQACRDFYQEHVCADALHEQIVRNDVVADLIDREPTLEADVVFGMRAFEVLEGRLGDHIVRCWGDGETSLRRPLD